MTAPLYKALRRAVLETRLAMSERSAIVRRALDIVLTTGALLVIAPVLLMIAVLVKATSAGPVFFAQERVGENGRRFRMWKFRTMIVDAEARKSELERAHQNALDGVRFKMVRDPRVTKLGRVLRKTSIDELPQLFNVLVGDMTLIGPRPPVWREVSLYKSRALRRLEVKPGLTCLWQISGRSDLSFDTQVDLDIEYIDTVRPHEELSILLRTVPAVVTGRGAY